MIRCLAIDDEPLALQQIVAYINKVPFLQLAAQCQSALEARQFLENDTVDAIFCDINMPDLNGMDFVKSLTVPPLIVFTTAYSEYAVEGFKVNAVDYLLKPFGLQDFQRAANRLKDRMRNEDHSVAADSAASGKARTGALIPWSRHRGENIPDSLISAHPSGPIRLPFVFHPPYRFCAI